MVTKEEERQAIKRIQAIIDELGGDSYIAAAMEGVLELAEENINNDFACSWKQREESARKELALIKKQFDKLSLDLRTAQFDMKEQKDELSELRRECLNLRMSQDVAKDLVEMVRINEKAAIERMEAATVDMVNSIFNKSANAEEYALEYTKAAERQQTCKKMYVVLQKYIDVYR